MLLIVALPAFVSIAVFIIVGDGFPIFYAHERVGRAGRSFACYKFRTMVSLSIEEVLAARPWVSSEWAMTQKLIDDPRITHVGRFLRKSSLDELPQLVNVLLGDMSLVGPRPVTASELRRHYGPSATAYKTLRPGLTGLSQVSGRHGLPYQQRVALDLDYVQNHSFLRDAKILARTIGVVLTGSGS